MMNDKLRKFAKDYLKNELPKLSAKSINLFKRMYSHQNLDLDINDVVDNMPNEKLDWAMQQVERTQLTPTKE